MKQLNSFVADIQSICPGKVLLDFISFKDKQIKSGKLKRLTPSIEHCLQVQFLSKHEIKLEKKYGVNPFVFGLTIASMSPFYRRIFRIAADLKIKFNPMMRTHVHFLESFDPLAGISYYPNIKSNLAWYSKKNLDPLVVNDVQNLLNFNFSAHHELLHVIAGKLIESPSLQEELKDYYLFMEGLVFIQDFYLSRELGPHWSTILAQFNSVYRPYIPTEAEDKEEKIYFLGMLLTHIASLRGWNIENMKMKLPSYAPYIKEAGTGFKKSFSKDATGAWLKLNIYKKYPNRRRKTNIGPYSRLSVKSFKLENLIKDEESLNKIYSWAKVLLYDSKH